MHTFIYCLIIVCYLSVGCTVLDKETEMEGTQNPEVTDRMRSAITTNINSIEYAFSAVTIDGDNRVTGTLTTDQKVELKDGKAYTFARKTELTFDEKGILLKGMLIDSNFFRHVSDRNVIFESYNDTFNVGKLFQPSHSYYQGGNFFTFTQTPSHYANSLFLRHGALPGGGGHRTTITVGDTLYEVISEVSFYPDGNIRKAQLYNHTEAALNAVVYTFYWVSDLYFHSDGTVIQGKLKDAQTADGINYPKWSWLRFYTDETIAGWSTHSEGPQDDWTGER